MAREKEHPRDGDIVCIVGKTGSGKTWCATDALGHEIVDGKRVVALDVTGDIKTYLERDGVENIVSVSTLKEARGIFASKAKVLVFTAGAAKIGETVQAWLSYLVEDHRRGDVFIADEGELVFPNGSHRSDYALRAMKLCRNWGVRLYVCSQRPQLMDNLLRANAKHVAVFMSDSELFVQGCHEFGRPSQYSRARKLKQFEYLYDGPDVEAPLPVYNSREERAPWLDDET